MCIHHHIQYNTMSQVLQYFSFFALIALSFLLGGCGPGIPNFTGGVSDAIRLNQVGYLPEASVQVVLTTKAEGKSMYLMDSSGQSVLLELPLAADSLVWAAAGETVWPQEIKMPDTVGHFRLFVPGLGYSAAFELGKNIYQAPFAASVKALYYQRASAVLEEKYAGKWHRPLGHPDTAVFFHPSSGKVSGLLSSPKGWYDAGDYNKYVVNAAFSLGQYFALYEDIGNPFPDGSLQLPESGNGISDYLDEMRWELDWLLSMQDEDGGLFHKLTTKEFEAMVMPHEANQQRYIVGKGTAATLNFVGATAQGARVFAASEPSYAAALISRAELAWAWALRYPAVAFTNPFDIKTGEYGDQDFSDEWYWAAAELYISTQKDTYRDYLTSHPAPLRYTGGNWTSFMGLLGSCSLLRYPDQIPAGIYNPIKEGLLRLADSLAVTSLMNPYRLPLTTFGWGSNSDMLHAAMILAAAHQLDPKPAYLRGITDVIDYILGKNALGYSFLTSFGHRSPLFIHHRQSIADGIAEPIPGLLSGGPNSAQQDKQAASYPPNAPPMQSWVDQAASYASNEVALNWNAPLSYVLGWLDKNATAAD